MHERLCVNRATPRVALPAQRNAQAAAEYHPSFSSRLKFPILQ